MSEHNTYMKMVFDLARKGTGEVSPNPLVGAVIVKNSKVIGEGYHQRYGEHHAEVNAIDNATESVAGATLYCNLEPCCHRKKQTPPCVPLIMARGIKKVVISNPDPNPQVNGKGMRELQSGGVEVISGILQDEGEILNRFYFHFIKYGRPWVTIKMAQTLDGYISPVRNRQEWISSHASQKLVHRWRGQYDAVMIGANTLRIDDAVLTVRHVAGRDPVRIIVSASLDFSPALKLFNHPSPGNTWFITTAGTDPDKGQWLRDLGCRVLTIDAKGTGGIVPPRLLDLLAENKITSLMVEGGQQLATQFLVNENFDQLSVFIAPVIWGEGLSAFRKDPADKFPGLRFTGMERSGQDVLLTFRPQVKKK